MPQSFTLTQEQYESLISLARQGVEGDVEKERQLDEWLRVIEKANGITRSIVWVQWQEADSPLPAGTRFPETWPPELRRKIELVSRPVARADVDAVITQHAKSPVNILVTRDPAGVLGYQTLDQFFIN